MAPAAAARSCRSGLGCGGVTIVEEGECVVERALQIAEFFKREQCGQCPACRMLTGTLAAVLGQVRSDGQVDKIVEFARGKGYCSLPAMAAAPVRSALRLFPEDFARHAVSGALPTQSVAAWNPAARHAPHMARDRIATPAL